MRIRGVIVLMMLFAGFISTAQNDKGKVPRILESSGGCNIYYLYGNDGWGNVPEGWKVQQEFLKNATEEDLEQTVLHSKTPAYRAMAYSALVSGKSKRCYDLLLDKLRDSSTFMVAQFDVYSTHNVASAMLQMFSSSKQRVNKAQQRHIDSMIVFSAGLEHLDKYTPASRLEGMDGLYERLRELHLSGTPHMLPIIAKYRKEDDIPIMIAALKEYKKGLDRHGGNTEGPEGDTNSALDAMMIWRNEAFMPALEELRDYEISRRYLDYHRVKMMFKVVMSYDNEWAYNFIKETFNKSIFHTEYFSEELYKAYYEENEMLRFRSLVERYGKKPFDWDINPNNKNNILHNK